MCSKTDSENKQREEGSMGLNALAEGKDLKPEPKEPESPRDPRIERLTAKGEVLIKQMRGSNEEAAYVMWSKDFDEDHETEIKTILERFSLKDKWQKYAGSLVMVEWEFRHFPVYWQNAFSLWEGAIFAVHNVSPHDKAPKPLIPRLSHWSDAAFIQWQKECRLYEGQTGSSASELRYIFRCEVVNVPTRLVIAHILDKQRKNMTPEKHSQYRYTVSTSTPEGKALLASPNGAGVAYLLIQHKDQLGIRTIDKIDIFPSFAKDKFVFKAGTFSLRFHVSQVDEEVDVLDAKDIGLQTAP